MKYLQSQATLMENIDLSPKDTKDKLTDWKNPPAVTDLKAASCDTHLLHLGQL